MNAPQPHNAAPAPHPNPDLTPLLDTIIHRLKSARAVQLVGHHRPDGDCIGSLLALHYLLEGWKIPHAMVAQHLQLSGYDQLPGYELIRDIPDPQLQPDLVLYLDTAHPGRGVAGWDPPAPVINIDHHESNSRYGEINWIDSDYAAVGAMLFDLIRHAGEPFSRQIAEALFIALSTDTGSFRFSNTTPRMMRIGADLIEAGARIERTSRIAFESKSPEGIKLIGHVMAEAHFACNGRLAWSEIRQPTYRELGGESQAPENLADSLRVIRGVSVTLLFHELDEGGIRVNFRSDGSLNVSEIAKQWGGGGHACAAGLTLEQAEYAAQRDEILASVCDALNRIMSDPPPHGAPSFIT